MGDVTAWSKTAATNATADPSINWQEGQAKNTINDSARAVMAALAMWRDDNFARITTAGSANNFTVALNQTILTYSAGLSFLIVVDRTNPSASPTMTVGGLSTLEWRKAGGTSWAASELVVSSVHLVNYNASAVKFESIAYWPHSHALTDIQAQAAATVLANITAGSASPTAVTYNQLLDAALGTTQGALLYRGASVWSVLSPGTSGQFLKTLGAAANPAWGDTLPSQTSNAGKQLVTDGTNASWSSNSVVTAAASCINLATTPALDTGSVNAASCSVVATGKVRLTFTNALTVKYRVHPTTDTIGIGSYYTAKTIGYVEIQFYNTATGASQLPGACDITIFGGI